jgi:hypothetical protein
VLRRDVCDKVARLHNEQGGSTVDIVVGDSPTKGFVVSILPECEERIKASVSLAAKGKLLLPIDVQRYIDRNSEHLLEAGRYLGTWYSDGYTYLDVVEVVHSLDEAIKLGRKHAQKAVYHLDSSATIEVV